MASVLKFLFEIIFCMMMLYDFLCSSLLWWCLYNVSIFKLSSVWTYHSHI